MRIFVEHPRVGEIEYRSGGKRYIGPVLAGLFYLALVGIAAWFCGIAGLALVVICSIPAGVMLLGMRD